MRLLAPAKLNLFLRILAREETGYHGIETTFLGIDFGDGIEVASRPEPGVGLTVAGAVDPGDPERNLVVLAARAFMDAAGLDEGLEIRLDKNLPVGAGLGGGSSDAAAVLRLLQARFPGRVEHARTLRIAATLGSDVPFFLSPTPYALAWNRGERMAALPPLPPRPVLLACPTRGISTARAYASVSGRTGGQGPAIFEPDALHGWESVARMAHNDFEPQLRMEVEEAGPLLDLLRGSGVIMAGVSGSGSTLFAVFQDGSERDASLERTRMAFPGVRLIACDTLERWPAPVDPRPASP